MSVIIDTGCANLTSLKYALERITGNVQISDDPSVILAAERLFIPGVGSAGYAMSMLERKNLIRVIKRLTQPVLGICLGMQLLMSRSEEGNTTCLDIIPGKVVALESTGLRLPHMGWNTVTRTSDHPLFQKIPADEYFYFVHSYGVSLSNYTIAECEYGAGFSAGLACKNFMGVQFHPERSGKMGSQILQNFLEMKP